MNSPGDPSAGPLLEKRRAPRTRCLREARCVFNKGFSDLSVLIRNLSATGAKLTGDELFCLPDEFDLRFSDSHGAPVTRRVKRVWAGADAVGVEFVAPEGPAALRRTPSPAPDAAAPQSPTRR